jgi:hypothetical protein
LLQSFLAIRSTATAGATIGPGTRSKLRFAAARRKQRTSQGLQIGGTSVPRSSLTPSRQNETNVLRIQDTSDHDLQQAPVS